MHLLPFLAKFRCSCANGPNLAQVLESPRACVVHRNQPTLGVMRTWPMVAYSKKEISFTYRKGITGISLVQFCLGTLLIRTKKYCFLMFQKLTSTRDQAAFSYTWNISEPTCECIISVGSEIKPPAKKCKQTIPASSQDTQLQPMVCLGLTPPCCSCAAQYAAARFARGDGKETWQNIVGFDMDHNSRPQLLDDSWWFPSSILTWQEEVPYLQQA